MAGKQGREQKHKPRNNWSMLIVKAKKIAKWHFATSKCDKQF